MSEPRRNDHVRVRPRRLRRTSALRQLVTETRLHPSDLVLPLFYREGLVSPKAIPSMPGVVQHSVESLRVAVAEAATAGVGAVMIFGVPEERDATGSGATDPDGILTVGVRAAVEAGGGIPVIADLCIDEFTDHGHCGVLDTHGRVDNDATLLQVTGAHVAASCSSTRARSRRRRSCRSAPMARSRA